jgi:RND family efflux transporter MFP subunit
VTGTIVRAAFTEGSIVQKGALLFVIDPRPFEIAVESAQGSLIGAKADQLLAEQTLARADALLKSAAITQAEWESRTATGAQSLGRVRAAEAALKAAQLDLEFASIRSPITGRVGRKLVSEGNLVGPTTVSPLTTVNSIDPLYVYFDVEESRALRVNRDEALSASITLSADPEHAVPAAIDFVDNHVEAGSGTIKFRAVLPNPGGRLADGVFAHVQLLLGKAHSGLLVADQAINADQDRRFVWVVDEAGKVSYRPVKLGALFGGLRLVRDGLEVHDRVLVRGLQRPHDGDTVTAQVISMRELEQPLEKETRR